MKPDGRPGGRVLDALRSDRSRRLEDHDDADAEDPR
jgi:hypothetical protein